MYQVSEILDEQSLTKAFALMVQLQEADDDRNADAIDALRRFISAQLKAM